MSKKLEIFSEIAFNNYHMLHANQLHTTPVCPIRISNTFKEAYVMYNEMKEPKHPNVGNQKSKPNFFTSWKLRFMKAILME